MPANRMQRFCQLWTDPQAFATTLLVMFVDEYGTEGMSWTAEAVRSEIQDDFKCKLPQPNLDRLMAAVALVTTDDFYHSLPDFIAYCNLLSGDLLDPRMWDPADAEELAWGITEAILLSPPEDEEPFTAEIRAYIGQMLDVEGIMTPPDVLRLGLRDVQDIAARVQSEFTDDPTMFEAIYQFEAGKTEDINQLVRDSLKRLADQLDSLPLANGTTADAAKMMHRALTEDAGSGAGSIL